MRRILGLCSAVVVALALAACPHPQPGPTPPSKLGDMAPQYPLCALPDGGTDALPTYKDVCEGIVTHDHRACVKCRGMHACLDAADVVYCVAGDNCLDPQCIADVAASDSARKRSALHR